MRDNTNNPRYRIEETIKEVQNNIQLNYSIITLLCRVSRSYTPNTNNSVIFHRIDTTGAERVYDT